MNESHKLSWSNDMDEILSQTKRSFDDADLTSLRTKEETHSVEGILYKGNQIPCVIETIVRHRIDDRKMGKLVRRLRKSKDLKLRHLSAATGYSVVHVSELERGLKAWTIELAQMFIDVLIEHPDLDDLDEGKN